jgi:hypothetical protein
MENDAMYDDQDKELAEATEGLKAQDGSLDEDNYEDIGDFQQHEPEDPDIELKPLPKGLKYEFLGANKTYPVWASRFYWPEMHEDAKRFVATCPKSQRSGNISQRNAMPLNYNLQIDLFDVWGIDFMGPFMNLNGYEHILITVDYVSKWVEAIPCWKASTEEAIQMIKMLIFPRYGVPTILISDGGSHFIGKDFKRCLAKLGIKNRVSTT